MSHPSDAELERLTGEPHIDGWPLYSGLPGGPKCSRPSCNGLMLPGVAIAQTWTAGAADFLGDPAGDIQTMSPGGPGKLVQALKCNVCGRSVTA